MEEKSNRGCRHAAPPPTIHRLLPRILVTLRQLMITKVHTKVDPTPLQDEESMLKDDDPSSLQSKDSAIRDKPDRSSQQNEVTITSESRSLAEVSSRVRTEGPVSKMRTQGVPIGIVRTFRGYFFAGLSFGTASAYLSIYAGVHQLFKYT
ncbi:hypothetical protein HDU67_002487 [Dinochytrium kinnereticum]|nr:hypothetical protein HDU67_002487 [Dinochytrium kinnereticum]